MITMRGTVRTPDGTIRHDQDVLLLDVDDFQRLAEADRAGADTFKSLSIYLDGTEKRFVLLTEYIELLEKRIVLLESRIK